MRKLILVSVLGFLFVGCAAQKIDASITKEETERKNAEIIETAQNNIALKMIELQSKENIKCDFYDPNGLQNRFFLEDFNFILNDKLIITEHPIIRTGKIYCKVNYKSHYTATSYPVDVIEKGVINGKTYSIYYSDLSGHVGGNSITDDNYWEIGCKRDQMTDEKECRADNYHSSVTIYRDKNGYILQIGYDHYPDKGVSIRINKNQPIKSGRNDGTFDYARSKNIVKSIKNTDTVFVRFVKWPYENEITYQLDVSAFEEAIKILDTIYSRY